MPTGVGRFHEDGWAHHERVFDPDACDAIVRDSARRTYPRINRELLGWATDRRWAGLVLDALAPDVRVLREQPVTKPARTAGTVPWHQDHDYLPMGPVPFLTCFLALDAVTVDRGCLWVEPGSHRHGPLPHVAAGQIRRLDTDLGARGDGGVAVPLAQGDVLAFSSLTFHRSGPNLSAHDRPAWIVQFCVADAVDERTGEPFTAGPLVASGGSWLDDGGTGMR